MNQIAITADLPPWADVEPEHEWAGLLLGNGGSRAIWDGFRYPSLFDKASSGDVAHPLSDHGRALFEAFQTPNFEGVLSRLQDARLVCATLGIPHDAISTRYEEIKTALIEAVHAVHIGWHQLPDATKVRVRDALLVFDHVYSTNYDLLVYWSMMAGDGAGFKDYFWTDGTGFDPGNTEVWAKSTVVTYLHGGLHIYRLTSGRTVKRPAAGGNLLDAFGTPYQGREIPLFISEGSAEEKLAAIRNSEYLSFAYGQFRSHRGPLVIFGHSLSEQDHHLVWAMQNYNMDSVPAIAISMMPDTPQNIMAAKAIIHQKLPGLNLVFFDARTHPLGNPELAVQ